MDYNWYAFYLSIVKNFTPEQSFLALEGTIGKKNITITEQDVLDMIKLKAIHTYKEIGSMYGISKGAAYRRIEYYRKKHSKIVS